MSTITPEVTPSAFALAIGRERDASHNVVLVGFKNQGNLGLGYLAATLETAGYHVEVCDVEVPPSELLATIQRLDPIVVGFSAIFQFYIYRFEELARYLRDAGAACHFTIGGHFPSLSPGATLSLIPQVDSVCRFEGELTLLELCDQIGLGRDWRTVEGIAYLDNGEPILTPLRPLLDDLDELPRPHVVETRAILGRRASQLVASRGCARACSFCSIHMFYRTAPGRTVRIRRPSKVADEMRYLYDERGASVVLFQDDDFPMAGKAYHQWARELLHEMRTHDLVGKMIWKISCRADATDPELLAEMRDAGLYMVYMGLESGNEASLAMLAKQTTVQQNETAVATLKRLGILFDFGFMMLEPSSTFESITANVAFLRRIVGDGSAAAEFCRMIPYDGTPIQGQLAAERRLRGNVCNPDYDFLDPRVEGVAQQVNTALAATGWIHGLRALSPQLKFAWHEVAIMRAFTPGLRGLDAYGDTLRRITRECNEVLMRVIEDLVMVNRDGTEPTFSPEELVVQRRGYVSELLRERNTFVLANQDRLLAAIGSEVAEGREVPG